MSKRMDIHESGINGLFAKLSSSPVEEELSEKYLDMLEGK